MIFLDISWLISLSFNSLITLLSFPITPFTSVNISNLLAPISDAIKPAVKSALILNLVPLALAPMGAITGTILLETRFNKRLLLILYGCPTSPKSGSETFFFRYFLAVIILESTPESPKALTFLFERQYEIFLLITPDKTISTISKVFLSVILIPLKNLCFIFTLSNIKFI